MDMDATLLADAGDELAITPAHIKAYLDYMHAEGEAPMSPPYAPDLMEQIKAQLYRLADLVTPPAPSPSIEAQLEACDWNYFDVMIGTVRSQDQLAYCLENNCYYVPARTITEKKSDLPAYVALHEEGLDNQACIRYYGQIELLTQVKRGDIPVPMSRNNDSEEYVIFCVKQWIPMEKPIAIRDSYKGRPRYTNLFLLQHCTCSYQLFAIRSAEDYKTCAAVIKAYNRRYQPTNLHIIGGKFILRTEGEDFVVMNSQGVVVDRFAIGVYENHPASVIFRLSDLMK